MVHKWSKGKREVERCLDGTLPSKISKENFRSHVTGCGFRPDDYPSQT